MSSSTERRDAARTLALVWVVLVLGVLAIGLAAHRTRWSSMVDPWDDSVVRWLEDRRTPGLDTAAAAGSHVADTIVGVFVAAVGGPGRLWWQQSWRPLVYFTVLVGGYLALYVIVTALVPRDRPPVEILDPGLVPDHSFPSGHMATSIVVYGAIVCGCPRSRPAGAGGPGRCSSPLWSSRRRGSTRVPTTRPT